MSQPRKSSFAWVYLLAILLSLAVIGGGVYAAAKGQGYGSAAGGVVGLIVALTVWPLASLIGDRHHASETLASVSQLREQIDRLGTQLKLISEQQLISDRAKQVAFRDKDREAFRRAITEDLNRQDYDAALLLADELDRNFGYSADAQRLRNEVMQKRDDSVRRQVEASLTIIDRHTDSEQWQAAHREAEQLRSVFPHHPRVSRLASDIEARRQSVKRTLIEKFNTVKHSNNDEAISVLKRLDIYLTPEEAKSFEVDAQSVLREKLHTLRSQFVTAVQDQQSDVALRLGDQIVNDFPNTQLAKEVRDIMATMRTQPAAAAT